MSRYISTLLALALLVCTTQSVAQSYEFGQVFGSQGSGEGQFGRPHNLAFDSEGNIYVPDFDNNRIQKLDEQGRFLMQWGSFGTGPGQFDGPVGIAVDSQDNVYVVELRNNRVQKFDNNDGRLLDSWGTEGSANGQFRAPSDIAAGSDDKIYVADRSNHRIQVFEPDGEFVRITGSQGSANEQFEFPTGVALTPSDVLYVADQGNNRIQIFDSAGKLTTVFGSPGSGPGQFNGPSDIAIDGDGDVIVVDKDNERAQVFGFDGEFLSQFGRSGTGPVQFDQPRGVIVDDKQRLYIADRDNHRFQVFEKQTRFELPNQINAAGDNFGGSIAADGQLIAIGVPGRDGGEGTVEIFRRDGDEMIFEDEIFVPADMSAAEFGQSLSLQGGILVVGAPGEAIGTKGTVEQLRAAVFQRAQAGWQFKLALRSNNQAAGDRFGAAVAIDGNMIAVGAPNDGGGQGAVYLFRLRQDQSSEEVAKLPPPLPSGKGGVGAQQFGAALALKQGRLAAGGPGNGVDNSGIIALYQQISDNLNPTVLNGSATTGDSFGEAVSLSGDSMLVGAPGDDADKGAAYFYPLGGNSVVSIPVTPAERPDNARFGTSVALRFARALIGSPGASQLAKGGASTGAAFSFDINDAGATSQDTDLPPANTCGKRAKGCGAVDSYGETAAIGNGISVVGAPQAFDGEGTTFVTLGRVSLFGDSFEGESTVFE